MKWLIPISLILLCLVGCADDPATQNAQAQNAQAQTQAQPLPQPQDQNQATNTTPAQPQPQPATKQTATAAPKADFSIQWNTNAPMLALNGRPLHTGANLSTILFDQATKVTVGDNTLAVKVPLGDMSADQYTINGLGMGQGTLSSLQDRNSVPVTIKMGPSPTDNDPGRYAITLRYLDIDFDEATYVTDSYAKQIHDQIVSWKSHSGN